MSDNDTKPVELAVFDFDGTCISGNSPVILVRHLMRVGMLQKRLATSLASWALRYKLRLPQNESWVRSIVFSAFEGTPKETADAYLTKFYDERLETRFRDLADRAIQRHRDAGRVVWMVSATFEPIALRAAERHGFDAAFSTRMRVADDGTYTRDVLGLPVEGHEKLRVVKEKADEQFGKGNWVLTHAYGDHHSDTPLLESAHFPCAVCPDHPLTRLAKAQGWTILNWKN